MNTPAATATQRRPGPPPLPGAQALSVTLLGELLKPAELRVSSDGSRTVIRLLLAQPGGQLPPVCAEYVPAGGSAAYVVWRQLVRLYASGTLVRIDGHGLRPRTLHGRRVLALEHTDSVRPLQPAFDARAAAAGQD
jgi:hypothetical protein